MLGRNIRQMDGRKIKRPAQGYTDIRCTDKQSDKQKQRIDEQKDEQNMLTRRHVCTMLMRT